MTNRDRMNQFAAQPLTEREQEVLQYMAGGLSNREIAERMVVALNTVKWYVRQIFNKLGVDSRQEAVERARFLVPLSGGLQLDPPVGNLPSQLSSFVGRESEIAEIWALLKRARLISLTGAPGSGKTRLALKVAESAAIDFADGVYYVSLATTKDHALVASAIAHELGVIEQSNHSLVETLQRYLANKRLLLLLDNFEHLLPAALLITELLAAAPKLIVLATSREPLRVSGEYEYLVPPLALPDAAAGPSVSDLLVVESVKLFVQRARMASSHFQLTEDNAIAVAGICRRLDGLPLAIELAAPRIKLFSPEQMLARLESRLGLLVQGSRDLPDRQRTLRDTLNWSHELLEADEKRLFYHLAVFVGGRTIDTVEAVCGSEDGDRTLAGLESLLNKNLLYQKEGPDGEPRFYMLETIHEYARERLQESGEQTQIQDRHLDYFLRWCETMAPGYLRAGQLALFRQTEAEMANIRTAFEWAVQSGQIEKAGRLITAVNYYLRYATLRVGEGYRLAKRLLPCTAKMAPQYRIPFLAGLSELAMQNDDIVNGRRFARRAQALAREHGDKHLLAWSLVLIFTIDRDEPGYDAAIRNGSEALTIFRALHDKAGMAYALNRLGEVYRVGGELDRAQEAYEEALPLCIETGETIREHFMYGNLGLVAYAKEEYEQAKLLFLIPLRQSQALGWAHWTITLLVLLAGALARLGEPVKAARIYGACARLTAELGVPFHPNDQPTIVRFEAYLKQSLDEISFAQATAEGETMTFDQVVSYALGDHNWPVSDKGTVP
jgi:non-specific serine/threonine protein kinase